MGQHRIGIDLGGTKIEILVLASDGSEALRHRIPTPTSGYEATLDAIATLVRKVEAQLRVTATIGIGIPGVISPATGRVKNANSIALNGHALDRDISEKLDREVRIDAAALRPVVTWGTNPAQSVTIDGAVPDPATFATWTEFERHQRAAFIEQVQQLVARVGS